MSDPIDHEANGPPAWLPVADEPLESCRVFDVHRATMECPRTGRAHPFYRLECPDWVNVVALTEHDELVLVRQFRQGSRTVTLEIPGGMVDPGETPAEAGARELLEETGHRAARMIDLGSLNPNPALFTNRCHMKAALGCEAVAPLRNGPTEETVVELLPWSALHDAVRQGAIDHALVVAALYAYELWRSRAD
jgi:8-oxo-dGTP pyrophosphatase MutT (NUDIX family)